MEDKSIADEQEINTSEVADSVDELICPIDEKPWDESACAVMEQRVADKVLQRLKAEQAPEEVAAPTAEVEKEPTAAENS